MIKREILDSLLTFMKTTLKKRFTTEQITEIKNKFCIGNDEANNNVYWCFTIKYRRGDDQFRQGLISKRDFEVLKTCNPNTRFNFGEISNNCCLDPKICEFTFSEDPEIVLKFLEGERHNEVDLDEHLGGCEEFIAKLEALYPELKR